MRVLRTTKGEGGGAPGAVLDDRLTIACGDGAVRIVELQRAGGRPMQAEEFLRGSTLRQARGLAVMPRYKLTIEYDGAPFVGWQIQDNGPSVQGAIEAAIEAFSGESVMVQGAGRTDAGVHALGQVAHFDLAKEHATDTVRDALNAHLRPHPIAMLSAERAAADFDARCSAVRRHYLYRIGNRRADLALDRGRAWRVTRPLDAAAMHAAAQRLVGHHDFTTFRSTECQAKSPDEDARPARRGARRARRSRSSPRRARSCTIRCARWSARWCWSATASGAPRTWPARLPRATAPPAGRSRRRTGFIW